MSPLSLFLTVLGVIATSGTVNSEGPNCVTAPCYIGYKIANRVDPTVNPCEDFYAYVCNKYNAQNRDKSTFTEANELYNEERQYIVSEPVKAGEEESAVKVKHHYQSCMDSATRNANGLQRIKTAIDNLGGWPLLLSDNGRNAYRTSWQEVHANYLQHYGDESSLFNVEVAFDTGRNPIYRIHLAESSGPFGINVPAGWDVNTQGHYLNTMTALINGLWPNQALPQVIFNRLNNVFLFRNEISQLIRQWAPTPADPVSPPVAIQNWQADYNNHLPYPYGSAQIDWLSAITDSFRGINNVAVNPNTNIVVTGRNYLLQLIRLLRRTSPVVIVDHLHLYFFEKNLKYADDNTVQTLRNLYRSLGTFDNSLATQRERMCYNFINMPHALDRLFVKRRIPPGFQANISQMFVNIREELTRQISNSRRVSNQGKVGLLRKAQNITAELGYPSWYEDDKKIDGFYKDIQIGADFMDNMLQIQRHNYVQKMALISPDSDTEPNPLLSVTNAFYFYLKNSIELSLSIMRPPFFHILWPDAVKYGMLGMTIGHELSHGFDSTGYQYDEFANYGSWYTPDDKKSFESVTKCYENQFAVGALAATPAENINARDFLPENIADGQGIRLAYGAFKASGQPKPAERYLDNFTDDQLFFLAYGTSACHTEDPEGLHQLLTKPYDFHSFPKFRVNGPLANMPEFSQAFQCAPNTPMNRSRKCNIWA